MTVLKLGAAGIHLNTFFNMSQPPGSAGGLLNAIVGSLLIVVLAVLLGTPIGLFTGTYLAEFAEQRRLGKTVQFIKTYC